MPPETPIGSVYIDFKIKGFEVVKSAIEGLQKVIDSVKLSAVKLVESIKPKSFEELNEKLDGLTTQFKEWDDSIKKSRERLMVLRDNALVKWFDDVIDRVIRLAKQQKTLKLLGGEWGLITYKVRELWKVLGLAFGRSVIGRIFGLIKILTKMYGVFALITAALMVFKAVWNYNIGGIQTLWINFIGNISKKWSDFNVKLRAVLIKLEPLFKAVLVPIFSFLNAFVSGFLDGFLAILDVIGNLVEGMKPFLDALDKMFSLSNKVSNSFGGWGRKLGKIAAFVTVFLAIATILMRIFQILRAIVMFMMAHPIVAIITAIAIGAYLVIKHWDKVKEFFVNLGEKIKSIFKGVFDFLINIFNKIKDIVTSPFKAISNVIGKIKGFFGGGIPSPTQVVGSTASYSTTINNQPVITIHTGNMDEANAYRIGESLFQGFVKYTQQG